MTSMKKEMKHWLSNRGLKATDVADHLGIDRRDMYLVLNGINTVWLSKTVNAVHRALVNVYGMTEAEYTALVKN